MKFKVYHQKEPIFFAPIPHPSKIGDCIHVANVEATSIDEVFKLTNHIDREWWKNEGIKWHKNNKLRSTSIGDIVVGESGKAYHCNFSGWSLIK